ncbi:MAG: substrate-binding domain-containing protein [Pleurocapsa sp.]
MLHKRPNSVVTLAILLTLFGVSKPAKAFLLAQSDAAPTTFTVPDELNEEAKIQIAASDSSRSINQSLTENFIAKYPQAQVKLETQASDIALNSLSAGKVDLVAIGRSLTAQEKAQGFVAVPVSREKIAIVVSNSNSYDGNLTIDQFAQIFRGEITDWSELAGAPGKIKLVDLPDSNDTRQAFPNYQVFQAGKFSTGSNTVKLEQDSTDAMITQLGNNGVGYAVANDVIDRDDVKILSMHQTQPDNQKYPFSQPFSLVYQGTPSEAVQAYLGFASAEGGEQVIVKRVGSLAAAEDVSVANSLADNSADDSSKTNALATNPEVADSGEINPEVADSGEINPEIADSGEINPEIADSGSANPEVADSGESLASDNLNVDGEATPEAKIASSDVGTPNAVESEVQIAQSDVAAPDAVESQLVTPDSVDGETTPEAETTETRSRWWWWLPLIIGIPLLGVIAASVASRKRSDREPAIGNIPDADSPNGGTSGSGTPGDNDLSTVGANASGLDNVTSNASGIGNAAIAATGGTALAGGAATNFVGGRNQTEGDRDLDAIDLAETEPVTEIPSNPVSEFTGQETKLQIIDQPTQLQTNADDEINFTSSGEDLSQPDGIAMAGGVAPASELLSDQETSTDEMTTNPVVENEDVVDFPTDIDVLPQPTNSQTIDLADQNLSEVKSERVTEADQVPETNIAREFRGDFVLDEETKRIPSLESEVNTSTGIDSTPETVSDEIGDSTSPEPELDLDFDLYDDEDTATDADSGLNIGARERTIQAGGAAALGGAAVSGFFNRGQDTEQTEQSDDVQELDDINTSLETTHNEFSDRVIADADIEAISGSADDSTLEEITFDEADNATDFRLNETILNQPETSSTTDFNLEDVSYEQQDNSFNASLESITFDEADNATDFGLNETILNQPETISTIESISGSVDNSTLEEITFDDNEAILDEPETSSTRDFNLEQVSLDEQDDSFDSSLESITLDEQDNATNFDFSLDEITLDEPETGSTRDFNLEQVSLDEQDDSFDSSLESITLDEQDNTTDFDFSLDEITLDEPEATSTNNAVNDLNIASQEQDIDINLDALGFDESESAESLSFDLLSNNTAEITSLSDDQSNDMNNISEWLDSLETRNQTTDNISEWLDTLDTNNVDSVLEDSNQERAFESSEEEDDISFQFLEDLLERDSNPNRDEQ